jgi:glycosyltransferase involved in cell wall biosynthesis
MTTALYITADPVGADTGGGKVTAHELAALRKIADVTVIRPKDGLGPFDQDEDVLRHLQRTLDSKVCLAHCYSGCLSKTVAYLKNHNVRVSYTVEAHRVSDSRQAHADVGAPYPYPHLTEPELWRQYSAGYWLADRLIAPSTHSRDVLMEQAADLGVTAPWIKIIPHGCTPIAKPRPLPKIWTLGYLGVCQGPDKGVCWLLAAWDKLAYKDAILVLAGRDSLMLRCISCRGTVHLRGWVDSLEEFYGSLTAYCQSSSTEGFALEVLEAMAHGRRVLCSDHAGAKDVVEPCDIFPARNVDALAEAIDRCKQSGDYSPMGYVDIAREYTWDVCEQRYIDVWQGMLQGGGE